MCTVWGEMEAHVHAALGTADFSPVLLHKEGPLASVRQCVLKGATKMKAFSSRLGALTGFVWECSYWLASTYA